MLIKKMVGLVLALTIALGVFVVAPASAAGENWTYQYTLSTGCNELQTSFRMLVEGITNGDLYYYDTIVEQDGLIYMAQRYSSSSWGPSTPLTWYLYASSDLEPMTGTWPMQSNVPITITFILRDSGLNELDQEVLAPFFCDGPFPGCDVLMDISSTSVVGLFVADTPLYSEPGVLVEPALTMPAGKTAWVLGKDATGQYYKIVWSCDYLYVPVSSMAPNPDAVWNNTPLPASNAN